MTAATTTHAEATPHANGEAPKQRKPRSRKSSTTAATTAATISRAAIKLLGENVMWNVPANHAKKNQYNDIVAALKAAGLSADVLKERSIRSACTRAINELEGRGEKRLRVIDVLKKPSKGDETFLFQFSGKTELQDTDGKRILWGQTNVKVSLDITTGKVACKDQETQEAAQTLIDRHLSEWNTSDISNVTDRLFQTGGGDLVPLANGVYFVPDAHKAFTDKVQAFYKSLGREMLRFPIPAGMGDTNAQIASATSRYLDELMERLDKAVDKWDASTRDSTMEDEAANIGTLRLKIQGLAEYQIDHGKDALTRLDALSTKLVAKIDDVKEEKKNLPEGDANSHAVRALAVMSKDEALTAKQIAEKAGLGRVPYDHLRELEEAGKVVREGKAYRLPA